MEITTVAEGVHFVHTKLVNWVVLVEGDRVALVDAGYPGQVQAVEQSVRKLGRQPAEIEAVLVTHAHVDHLGGVPELVARYSCRVLTSQDEAPHVRGEVRESATPLDVTLRSYNPRILRWGLQVAAAGGTRHPKVMTVEPVPYGAPLDLPRSPKPVSLAGHTTGHTAYVVGDAIALGDALATGHPTSKRHGPQLLRGFFHHDEARLRETLGELRTLDAERLLPGHGPTLLQPLAQAIDEALA